MREQRAGKERKRGSRAEWKRDGSIYRLLSSDASGITFVRFAGVDDVVAHGVGVISTREGTYLPITVLSPLSSLLPSCAHIRTHLLDVTPRPSFPLIGFIYSTVSLRPLGLRPAPVVPREVRSALRPPPPTPLDFYLHPNLYTVTPSAFVISAATVLAPCFSGLSKRAVIDPRVMHPDVSS